MERQVHYESIYWSSDLLWAIGIIMLLCIVIILLPQWITFCLNWQNHSVSKQKISEKDRVKQLSMIGRIVCVSFIGILVLIYVASAIRICQYREFNKYETIQGIVTNYISYDTPSGVVEEFDVGDQHFCIFPNFLSLVYKGGIIKEGQLIIIRYRQFVSTDQIDIYYIAEYG